MNSIQNAGLAAASVVAGQLADCKGCTTKRPIVFLGLVSVVATVCFSLLLLLLLLFLLPFLLLFLVLMSSLGIRGATDAVRLVFWQSVDEEVCQD